jgi:hypothetical protein
MKQKVYILAEILTETQKQYPHIDLRRFRLLYDGWRAQGMRHGRHSQFYTVAWQRGWLSEREADDFRKYIGIR